MPIASTGTQSDNLPQYGMDRWRYFRAHPDERFLESAPSTPAWQEALAPLGEFLNKAMVALDPTQSIPYILLQQPAPQRFAAAHPKIAEAIQNLTTLGLGHVANASGHFGVPGKPISDEDAFVIAMEHQPDIEKAVENSIKSGRTHPQDREDAVMDGLVTAAELAKKHVGTKEDYGHYLRKTLRLNLTPDAAHATDALAHATVLESPEGEILHEPKAAAAGAGAGVGETKLTDASPVARVQQLSDWIESIQGTHARTGEIDPGRTATLQNLARDYFIRNIPTNTLVSRYHVSKKTVSDLLSEAPTRPVNISDVLNETITPEEIQRRLEALPPNLQTLAKKYLVEGKSFSNIAQETGRAHDVPTEPLGAFPSTRQAMPGGAQNYLRDRLVEILNNIRKPPRR